MMPIKLNIADRAASTQALVDAEQAADEVLEAIPQCLCDGDELYRALVETLGYGGGDARLRAFMRTVQKHLERNG